MKRKTGRFGNIAKWVALTVLAGSCVASIATARDTTTAAAASAGMNVMASNDEPTPAPEPAQPAPPAPPAPRARRPYGYSWRFSMPTPPVAPVAPTPPAEEMAPSRVLPRGWFGFGIQCDACSANREAGDSVAVWVFGSRPRVYLVTDGGPASKGGIQRGDVITAIDGVSILSEEGGRRFSSTRPGQVVRWTLLRDGATRTAITTAEERPEARARHKQLDDARDDLRKELARLNEMSDLRQMRAELERLNQRIEMLKFESMQTPRLQTPQRRSAKPLKYAGVVGTTEVEVRGTNPVIVSESENKNEVVINLGESVVVIRVPEGTATVVKKKDKD